MPEEREMTSPVKSNVKNPPWGTEPDTPDTGLLISRLILGSFVLPYHDVFARVSLRGGASICKRARKMDAPSFSRLENRNIAVKIITRILIKNRRSKPSRSLIFDRVAMTSMLSIVCKLIRLIVLIVC